MGQVEVYLGYKDPDGKPSKPLPKQQEAYEMRGSKKHVMMDGSFGSGKTDWLVYNVVHDAVRFPGNEILMGRKKLDWFRTSTLPSLLEMIPEELLLRHDKQNHIIEIKTDGKPSTIYYRQLDSSRDAMNQIKSMNLGLFAPDQIEELEEEVFMAAQGRLRKANTPRQSISSSNPRGHNWVWRLWIDKRGGDDYGNVGTKMWTKGVPPPLCQEDVNHTVTDNPYLPWDYIKNLLEDYPEQYLDRYVFGGWNNYEGLVYPMWDSSIHMIKPFEIPEWWNHYVAMDWGHRNPCSIGFYASDPDGNIYRYDALYEANQWVDYHADRIFTKLAEHGITPDDIEAWPADPSIFSAHTEVTIGDEFRDHGIYWQKAKNDIQGGINRCSKYLSLDPNLVTPKFPKGKPQFFVFDIPANIPFKEEIGDYSWDEMEVKGYKNQAEKPKKVKDHAMDEFKYLINHVDAAEIPKPIRPRPEWLKRKGKNLWMSG